MKKKSNEPRHHQHFALDEANELVHIEDVDVTKRYFCIYCHEEVIAKRGVKNEHHFAHKNENPDCGWESYLHSLAKFKIADWLEKSESIDLVLPTFCPKHDKCPLKDGENDCVCEDKTFNLKKYYELKGVEIDYDGFTPDILLLPKGKQTDPIFIEIFVTHPCSYEKINSGHRIIEFKINEECRIEEIINGKSIDYKDSHNLFHGAVTFHNFKKQYSDKTVHEKEVGRFTLHKSGKSFTDTIMCSQIENHRKGLCQILVNAQMICAPGFYNWGFAIALKHGIQFKSCTICKYSVYNEYYNTRICKLYKKYNLPPACSSNDATKCNLFQQGILDLNEECPVNALDTNSEDYIFLDNSNL